MVHRRESSAPSVVRAVTRSRAQALPRSHVQDAELGRGQFGELVEATGHVGAVADGVTEGFGQDGTNARLKDVGEKYRDAIVDKLSALGCKSILQRFQSTLDKDEACRGKKAGLWTLSNGPVFWASIPLTLFVEFEATLSVNKAPIPPLDMLFPGSKFLPSRERPSQLQALSGTAQLSRSLNFIAPFFLQRSKLIEVIETFSMLLHSDVVFCHAQNQNSDRYKWGISIPNRAMTNA